MQEVAFEPPLPAPRFRIAGWSKAEGVGCRGLLPLHGRLLRRRHQPLGRAGELRPRNPRLATGRAHLRGPQAGEQDPVLRTLPAVHGQGLVRRPLAHSGAVRGGGRATPRRALRGQQPGLLGAPEPTGPLDRRGARRGTRGLPGGRRGHRRHLRLVGPRQRRTGAPRREIHGAPHGPGCAARRAVAPRAKRDHALGGEPRLRGLGGE